jgi:hypothetical protein
MRSHLVWCFCLNILATLLAIALLYFHPALSGYSVTSAKQTRYIAGGQLPAALLLISANFLIGIYLAIRLYKFAIS